MVGALADWFAVTALFRHPLGIPVPHTAIIKRKKDQLGANLSSFVGNNFLAPEVVSAKVESAQIPLRVGTWLAEPENAQRVAKETSTVLRGVVGILREDDIQQITVMVRASDKTSDPYRGEIKKSDDDKKEESLDSAGDKDAIKKLLTGIDGVTSVVDLYANADGLSFSLTTSKDCRAEVSRAIIDAKLDLLQLEFSRSELESTFIRLVGGAPNASN